MSSVPSLTGAPIGDVIWSKEGTDAEDFSIDPSTGVVSMVSQDFESPADANTDNVYEVTVKATDADGNSAMVSIEVTVTDVVETATLAITGLADASVEENQAWTSPVPSLTGTPVGDVIWSKEGTDAEDFSIDPSTGVVSMVSQDFESPADANTDNVYEVTVRGHRCRRQFTAMVSIDGDRDGPGRDVRRCRSRGCRTRAWRRISAVDVAGAGGVGHAGR